MKRILLSFAAGLILGMVGMVYLQSRYQLKLTIRERDSGINAEVSLKSVE